MFEAIILKQSRDIVVATEYLSGLLTGALGAALLVVTYDLVTSAEWELMLCMFVNLFFTESTSVNSPISPDAAVAINF
jgi:hypothetical protein